MTYPEAAQYLESFVNYEKKDKYDYNKSFNIDKIKKIASLLGNPQDATNAIHIAGTKGKGSTSAFIYSILKAAGFRVGLYTSPHLVSFRERIRINDTLISEEDVAKFLGDIKKVLDASGDDSPSLFEVYTALAYLYFREKKVDFAVYETGMGGRFDATNIVNSLVSCITPISYDHMDKLGDTLGLIAGEKAAIIKERGICVSAPQEGEALDIIKKVCVEKNARLILAGNDIKFKELYSSCDKEVFSVFGHDDEYPMLISKLLGRHQVVNAATAIGVIEALRFHGIVVPPDCVARGVESCRWPGRLEVVARSPLIVLDGAQNKASAFALADAVKRLFKYKNLILVLGVSKDKDLKGILGELLPISNSIVLTKSKIVERALEPAKMMEFVENQDVFLTSSTEEALSKAMELAKPNDLILITGSLFVVGEARERLCPEIN
ncbi:MAG: folylpolyglutamate synthase/dihydrofolate synthase family protein [Candidatus Omnitrophota bacterium]|jgi:dihydrofolate synthase/folylpolyglutamate synthase